MQRILRYPPLVTLLLVAGCAGADQPPPVRTSYVTVSPGTSTPEPDTTAALDPDGLPRISVVAAEDRCVADSDRVASGSVRFSFLNLDVAFTDLAVRLEGDAPGRSSDNDLYRLPNVGPEATGEMTVNLAPGEYTVVCAARERDDRTQRIVVE